MASREPAPLGCEGCCPELSVALWARILELEDLSSVGRGLFQRSGLLPRAEDLAWEWLGPGG